MTGLEIVDVGVQSDCAVKAIMEEHDEDTQPGAQKKAGEPVRGWIYQPPGASTSPILVTAIFEESSNRPGIPL